MSLGAKELIMLLMLTQVALCRLLY
jgi:hypothetical protein